MESSNITKSEAEVAKEEKEEEKVEETTAVNETEDQVSETFY